MPAPLRRALPDKAHIGRGPRRSQGPLPLPTRAGPVPAWSCRPGVPLGPCVGCALCRQQVLLTAQVSAQPRDAPSAHRPGANSVPTPSAAIPALAFPNPSGTGGPHGLPSLFVAALRLGGTKMPAQVHGTGGMLRNQTHLNAMLSTITPRPSTHTPPPPGSPLGCHACRGRAPPGLSLLACVSATVALNAGQPPGSSLCPPHQAGSGLRRGLGGGIYPFCPTLCHGSRTRPGTQRALGWRWSCRGMGSRAASSHTHPVCTQAHSRCSVTALRLKEGRNDVAGAGEASGAF